MTDDEKRLQSHLPTQASSRAFLLERLEDYLFALKGKKKENEFVDLSLASQLIEGYKTLVEIPDVDLILVEGGIGYLISEEDEIPDKEIAGFDDDADVYNYVCKTCSRADLVIDLSEL